MLDVESQKPVVALDELPDTPAPLEGHWKRVAYLIDPSGAQITVDMRAFHGVPIGLHLVNTTTGVKVPPTRAGFAQLTVEPAHQKNFDLRIISRTAEFMVRNSRLMGKFYVALGLKTIDATAMPYPCQIPSAEVAAAIFFHPKVVGGHGLLRSIGEACDLLNQAFEQQKAAMKTDAELQDLAVLAASIGNFHAHLARWRALPEDGFTPQELVTQQTLVSELIAQLLMHRLSFAG